MENIEYAIAYKEILEILKYISLEDYNKIPKEKIKIFEDNADKNYNFNYNPNITLNEQNVSKRAKAIIIILFRDYWATDIQKEKIIAKQNEYILQIEKDKQEKYSFDNIFENHTNESVENISNNLEMIEVKESIFKKIINKIKKIFIK